MIKKRITKISNKFISLICQPYFLQLSLVFIAFIIPLIILYTLDPGSFEFLWKGRAPFLLFIWLLFLETFLGWNKIKKEKFEIFSKKTLLIILFSALPTIYSLGLNFGFKEGIIEIGKVIRVPSEQFGEWYLTHSWPFSFEYILFGLIFLTLIFLMYGKIGLKIFSVTSFLIMGVGVFYMIDTFYPYGTFFVLQSFVPVTVSGASIILNLLGYGTTTFPGGQDGLGLTVTGTNTGYSAIVSWSCAGSHSLFLYSFMIMLFLRGTSISRIRKIVYVIVGAIGTFMVNIVRIVSILLAGVNSGASLAATFHEFYGEFYFIGWMFIFLTIIYLLETRIFKKQKNED